MDTRSRPRPTLRDVARIAGVSVATASMALRGHPRTARATQEAVRAAAAKLQYVPNSAGRGLRAQRTGVVALVIPHSSEHVSTHPYFLALIDGIEKRLSAAQMLLMLSISPVEHDSRTPYLRILQSRAVDGAIVASARLADRNVLQLAAAGFPAVFIGRYPASTEVEAVGVDDAQGGLLATDHLIEVHGRKRVAHIAGPKDSLSALDRLDGYRTSLGRRGLAYEESLVVSGDYDQRAGEAACERLLVSGQRFDGLFAGNDDAAVGAIRVFRRHGIRVPEDVAVVGFDDGLLAPVVAPSLTTVRQPVRDLGHEAASRLLDRIEDREALARQSVFPVELVVRNSCGCG